MASGLLAVAEVGLRLASNPGFRRSVVDAASTAGDAAGRTLGERTTKGITRSMRSGQGELVRVGAQSGSATGSGFGRGLLASAEGSMARFGSVAARGGQRAASGIVSGLSRAVSGTARVFGLLTAAAGVFGLRTVASLESSQIAFETFLGSAQKASSFIKELQALAKSTPFEFTDLTQLSQRLLAAGFSAKSVVPTITAIGDAVAGLGGSPELLGQVANAFAQIQTKGKLSNEELLQLSEAGVPAVRILADAFGVTTGQLQKMAEQGKITAAEAIPALVAGIENGTKSVRGFGGLMEKQGKSLSGLFSTLKDTVAITLAGLIEPNLPQIKAGISKAIVAVGAFGKWVSDNRTQIASFGLAIAQGALVATSAILRFGQRGLGAFAMVIGALGGLVGAMLSAAGFIVGAARTAFGWVPGVSDRLKGADEALARFGQQARTAFGNAQSAASAASGALGRSADQLDGVASAAGRARAKLNALPLAKSITVRLQDNITGRLVNIQRNINALTGKVVSVQIGSVGGGIRAMASGGVARGGPGGGELALVGEEGPEFAVLPGGTRVVNAATTAALRRRGTPPGAPTVGAGGLSAADRALIAELAGRPVVVAIDGREIARVVRRRDAVDALR